MPAVYTQKPRMKQSTVLVLVELEVQRDRWEMIRHLLCTLYCEKADLEAGAAFSSAAVRRVGLSEGEVSGSVVAASWFEGGEWQAGQ